MENVQNSRNIRSVFNLDQNNDNNPTYTYTAMVTFVTWLTNYFGDQIHNLDDDTIRRYSSTFWRLADEFINTGYSEGYLQQRQPQQQQQRLQQPSRRNVG